jgi:hypothetical protein
MHALLSEDWDGPVAEPSGTQFQLQGNEGELRREIILAITQLWSTNCNI